MNLQPDTLQSVAQSVRYGIASQQEYFHRLHGNEQRGGLYHLEREGLETTLTQSTTNSAQLELNLA